MNWVLIREKGFDATMKVVKNKQQQKKKTIVNEHSPLKSSSTK